MRSILFVTGTRADFGKIKSLIGSLKADPKNYRVNIFVTGMHMLKRYGNTINEIKKNGFGQMLYPFINSSGADHMDQVLSATINGLSRYIKENPCDLIVVHGDRIECLAGALVGSLNNIRVAHIEGGELSGSIDEMIRHATSKFAHHHLVANESAKRVLNKLGEVEDRISIIGSPDVDVMMGRLIPLKSALKHYEISFKKYAILIFHPVTTIGLSKNYDEAVALCEAVNSSKLNYIVIEPNNDYGSDQIRLAYERRLKGNDRVRVFPSLRFEAFLTLLKNSQFILGNSSAGIREAPIWGVPSVNVGTRQQGRVMHISVKNTEGTYDDIVKGIGWAIGSKRFKSSYIFGRSGCSKRFKRLLDSKKFWAVGLAKGFDFL